MYTLEYIGIYPSEIKRGIYIAESALEEVGLADLVDDLNECAVERLKLNGSWESITNSIIQAYFEEAQSMIQSKTSHTCTYFVNGLDSHFMIDGDEVSPHKEF